MHPALMGEIFRATGVKICLTMDDDRISNVALMSDTKSSESIQMLLRKTKYHVTNSGIIPQYFVYAIFSNISQ